ncbi:MAG: LCP family protein [Patescibacteria group bacterium]
MTSHKIDLIKNFENNQIVSQAKIQPEKIRLHRPIFRILAVLAVIIALFSTNTIISQNSLMSDLGRISFWKNAVNLIISRDQILQGELSNRVNILILGIGGENHDGPYLTDTMILASYKPSTKQLALLSIPRDLYVPIPGNDWQKINAANSLGMKNGNGGKLASQVVSNVFNIPIHYWVRVDFNIFKKIVDELGGVEVNVDKTFVDYQFPGAGYNYRVIKFEKGLQTMDGDRALVFARSRHGSNNEGSDFARSKRQQKIISAIKQKVEKLNLLSQPAKILRFYNLFKNNVSSNLSFNETVKLAKLLLAVEQKNITSQIIEIEPKGPLKNEIASNGAYILKTRTGDFKELAAMARNIFNPETFVSNTPSETPEIIAIPKIIVLNGTTINNLAKEIGDTLLSDSYEVVFTGNTPTQDWVKTVIFPKKSNQPGALSQLQDNLNAEIIQEIPANLETLTSSYDYDFLIVLGNK